ncbi:hypothetical protein SSZBM1_14 [Synechococcus phage S-SZBM1]|uniref:Uncharacterized protein n=1 Tax=Synechococcus phage S-SZBM1 TaxID=2926475 RepID=A0AC61TSL3_9CAUD|nr:hypothetical protein PP650_gp014 [Synechococcus phage S-SZBM1]UNH61131.1 hypothetical protein SSZBM1_14 [Synechococcus phage S-SZBM1]
MTKFDSSYYQHKMNVYQEYIEEKGFTLAECNRPAKREVPKHLQDRYSSWEEYQEAIHDFLNGM